jgi:hypothetical protein
MGARLTTYDVLCSDSDVYEPQYITFQHLDNSIVISS